MQILNNILLRCILLALIFLFGGSTTYEDAWGFFGHRRINRMAVFTLPTDMIGFYKRNIEFITEHAVDPDKRRYATRHEAVRHYIDIDHWGEYPFEEVPRKWMDVLMKYTDVYSIDFKGDTTHLFGKDKFARVAFSLDGSSNPYRDFFYYNVLPEYYEDEWNIACDSLNELLAIPVVCQKAFAVDRFSEYGILPYNLVHYYRKLVKAFEEKNFNRILRLSAEIGHYVGDAHVPLHTTENYNGQLTNQVGIHAFWESRLPELYADENYDFFVGKSDIIEDPNEFFWNIVLESHQLLDSVLLIEQDLREQFPEDQQMCYEERLGRTIRTQCEVFAKAYHERLSGMVERRMTAAIHALGCVWYSAWVEAGQPDINRLQPAEMSRRERKRLEIEAKEIQKGEPKGRAHSESQ
ncbi:MAG: zinc dependent phospholipase C family protein [Bacteroidota bacterium]